MRKPLVLVLLAGLAALAGPARAVDPPPPSANPKPEEKVREIFVPFEDLQVLLEGPTQRVLLAREQYDELLAKAKKTAEGRAPIEALLVSADYAVTAGDERAEITGLLVLSVLEDGLHAVGLDLAGVGLRSASLDGKGAPIGLADDGRLTLFVEGKGQHKLDLAMVAPLQTTAARQILNYRLPVSAAARLRLTVPGDVEVKSGAPVVERVFDETAGQTRIELLPQKGDTSLVMTLNSRLKRKDRIVVARSVLVDEVTGGYERLHATVSMSVLHRAVDQFRFAVPAGFDVTDVRSPMLARWAIAAEGGRRILEVQLREETTETVVLNLSAVRTAPNLQTWSLPQLEPLDVVGHVAVVCLAIEDRLKAEAVTPDGLIPIDTTVLAQALPATVLEAQPGAARIRPVVAYYAPQPKFGLTARFVRPPASLRLTTNLLAILEDSGVTVRGGFALVPEEEKLFALDFSVPAGWEVTSVTDDSNQALRFERYGAAGQAGRINVRLPSGVAAGTERRVFFTAIHVPKEWFGDWTAASVEFPVFAVAGAARDDGAIAVDARDDMIVRPEALDRLTPLDENEKTKYGLAGVSASLAYRYEAQPYKARLAVERTLPRITAQTFSFFRVERDALVAHYELVYDVAQARTRRLALALPKDTPTALSIRGLDGVTLKEYAGDLVGENLKARRRWTAMLSDSRSGRVRLAVDFEQRLESLEPANLILPVVEADGVAYQSGLVAVEGSPELDVQITASPRRVDIGELVDAEYQPGRRLLGAFGFVGDPPPVKVSVARHPAYGLPPTIIQRGEFATVMSADGLAQTAARFLLRTKALFLEVRLPEGSTLWAATLDGQPTKPQREKSSLLLNLPAGAAGTVRDLQVVYETPVGRLGLWRGVSVVAPRLLLHGGPTETPEEVPMADLLWHLYLPTGYKVVRAEGTVVTHQVQAPPLALASMAGGLWHGTGGVDVRHGLVGLVLSAAPMVQFAKEAAPGGWKYARGTADQPGQDSFGGTLEHEDGSREAAKEESGVQRGDDAAGLGLLRQHAKTPAPKTAPARPSKPVAETPPPPPPAAPGEKMVPLAVELPKPVFAGVPTVLPPVAQTATTPATPAAPPPDSSALPATKGEARRRAWSLEGVSSLKIDLERTGQATTFRSLGAEPRLELTVADLVRLDSLAWGLALAVLVAGLALTTRPVGRKVAYVVGVGLVATLVPVITGRIELAMVVNGSFFAACLLVPYYLAAGVVRWAAAKVRKTLAPSAAPATMLLVMAAGVLALGAAAAAAEPAGATSGAPYIIQVVPPPAPVKVPDDALILPYDPATKVGIPSVDRVLVPYDRYVALWNLANPDKPIGAKPPPAPYALAGATLSAALKGDEYLLVEGRVDIDVYTDEYAIIPLPLEGGVLARADLDGKPARLSITQPAPAPAAPGAPPAEAQQQVRSGKAAPPPEIAPPKSFIVLYVSGKGRHRLDLAVRMRLEKRGGWRVAEGRLPAAPATAMAISVPDGGTELRLGGVPDRRTYETKAAGETIQTALSPGGALSVQWRPKVSEGRIDQTLTAASTAVLDVQEDSLRVVWSLHLEFRAGEREFFTVELPPGYSVEKVEGTNVRGWEVKPGQQGRQDLEVTLLKRAKNTEDFSVTLWKPTDPTRDATGKAAAPDAGLEFEAPTVGVAGALRHSGQLVIRRSPLIDLRTVSTSGVTRADLPSERNVPPGPTTRAAGRPVGADESPLGIRAYQAYQFAATPFVVRLAAAPVAAKVAANVQMLLKIAERERSLEARVMLSVTGRPLYRARFVVPADLRLDRVVAPGTFEWALVTEEGGRKVLTVYLASGVEGSCPIVLQGKLGENRPALETAVPRLEVLDVDRQQGDIVVQVDPAFDVRSEDLANIERVLLERVFGWLQEGQKGLAQMALHYTRPDYGGRLTLAARKPDVMCFTVTNARVTDRAIEETVLVIWTIKNAGIREVSFLVPAWMKDAKISVPLLRQKTVKPASAEPGAPLRVRLELQDEVMDELRVLVENDRLLSGSTHEAPIPVVETGRTDRRYVALESAGRDEVVVEKQAGLEPLSRQQKEWAAVAGLLRGGQTQAFIVASGAEAPILSFRTKERATVETAKARIGLAQTVLIIDPSGAYRAAQTYRIDNRTEQFLEIQMPEGAALWTAVVAGEPVKPTLLADAARPRHVCIPLVKTAAGDLDYAVVLKYGGQLDALESLRLRVAFPLIRTVNVNVELSQVRLYLPETHVWFDFRGTMHGVTEEGDIEAGILAYQNKQADRLMQTLRSDNPFARTRALANLKSISGAIQTFQGTVAGYAGNKALQTELSNSSVIVQNAAREIKAVPQAGEAAQFDNNDAIRGYYNDQRNTRARNLVNTLGANWAGVQPPTAAPGKPPVAEGRFNTAWLSSNRLENPVQEGEKAQAAGHRVDFQGGDQYRAQGPQAGQQAAPADQKQMFQQFAAVAGKGTVAGPQAQPQQQMEQRGRGVEDVVQRYQQKLEKRAEKDQQVQTVDRLSVIGVGGGGREIGGFEGLGRGGRASFGTGVTDEGVAVPAGMASLDVELPTRGRLYRFAEVQPREDVAVHARAASMPLIEGLERVGGVAAVVVIVLAVRRWVRGRTWDLRARGILSTVLIVLGAIAMFGGVFPVAGLVAVLVGVVIKVRLFRARRRPAAV